MTELNPAQILIVIAALRDWADQDEADAEQAIQIAYDLLMGELIIVKAFSPISIPELQARIEEIPDPWSVR